jgi:hypothetical protein
MSTVLGYEDQTLEREPAVNSASRSNQRVGEFYRLIAQWLGSTFNADRETLTIPRMCILYVDFARQYYRKNGKQTSEVHCIQLALRPLTAKCGREKVSNFGARRLKDVWEEMISRGWSRSGINAAVQRINRVIRWGVENEHVRPEIYQACRAVTGLRLGRSEARETASVKPVLPADIDAVKPFVSEQVWAMIQLQLVSSMRLGEVSLMRLSDFSMTGDVWEYRPSEHKTEHHGRKRLFQPGCSSYDFRVALSPSVKSPEAGQGP